MTNKIQMDLSVRDAQMVAAWKRSTQSIAGFNQELDKIGQKQRRNKNESGQFFKGMTTNLAAMAAGYISVAGAAGILMNKNREILEQTEEVAKKYDEIFRKFRVQSGLRGLEADNAKTRILEISERQAVTSEQGTGAATQLVSSGFSAAEASGESLEEFLRVLNASNAAGKEVDSASLAKAISSYLDAQELDKNSKNVALVGRSVQALFKNTNLQLADLQDLAKVSSVFKGKLSIKEQLGAFSTLVDSMPASEAKTGLRNFVLQSATASAQKEKVKSLDTIGLKPTDVDFIGENLDQVLERLATGLAKLPVEEQLPVLTKIYEKENAAVVSSLIDKRQKVTSSYTVQDNQEAFQADVAEATSGRNAAERRAVVRREIRRNEQDDQGDLIKLELDEMAEETGVSRFRMALFDAGYHTSRFLGANPATSAELGNVAAGPAGGLYNLAFGEPIADEAMRRLELRKSPASDYKKGELPPPPPPPPPAPSLIEEVRQQNRAQNQYNRANPGDNNMAVGLRNFFRNAVHGDDQPRGRIPMPNLGGEPAPEPASFPRYAERPAKNEPQPQSVPSVDRAATDALSHALLENTAAIKAAVANKPGAEQRTPIKVDVTVSADTATLPNGPRPSASLARPLK